MDPQDFHDDARNILIPFTVEAQLELYSRYNERYELLWHAWKQNKRWLVKLLELTFPSFPGYSQHDASHADTVLHNIERVLGEDRIRRLSASDCFMLLHTAYIHDIGMCITAEDRDQIICQDDFVTMLDGFSQSSDCNLRDWAATLQKTQYPPIPKEDGTERTQKLQALYREKLRVYYALVYAMSEFQRNSHGDRSKERLEDLVEKPEKLGGGFSMSGIPMRIFLSIAACGGLHTTWGFSPILELPKEDSGYALDKIHPRFVAVMLQLGDALDLDNDRFHPLMLDYVGSLSNTSQNHYNKHKAIRCLQITPSEIFIEANCVNQEVLHLVRQACDGIETLLKEASYHWAEIVPPELHGCLPTLLPPRLRINGKSIPKDMVTCKFNISQEKAFLLLEGSNLYSNTFAFLRELLQNAIDATKIECFHDYKCSNPRYTEVEVDSGDVIDFVKALHTERYPIEVRLKVAAAAQNGCLYFSTEEMAECSLSQEPYEYGVLVEIQDVGTGITQEDLKRISQVGTSHDLEKKNILSMPPLLRPTGKFGIGLQSVFIVNNNFSCLTHARNEEAYRVTFSSVSGHDGGYINVEPEGKPETVPYGTTFRVFVPYNQKHDYRDYLSVWSGKDPFDLSSQQNTGLLQAEDLQAQMVYYINSLSGDKLFPICIYVENQFSEEIQHNLSHGKNKVNHILFTAIQDGVPLEKWTYRDLTQNLCWAFWNRNWQWTKENCTEEFCGKLEGGDRYRFDVRDCKLYIWSAKGHAFACFGAARYLNTPIVLETTSQKQVWDSGIRLFYRGIRLHITDTIDDDMELLEYLDLKDGPTEKLLQLNRDILTEEGKQYLRKYVYPEVMDSARRSLCQIAKQNGVTDDLFQRTMVEHFFNPTRPEQENRSERGTTAQVRDSYTLSLISFILLSYFAKIASRSKTDLPACAQNNLALRKELDDLETNCMWETLLRKCADHLNEKENYSLWDMELLQIQTYETLEMMDKSPDSNTTNIADVLTSRRQYAIVSMRESPRHEWKHSLCRVPTEDVGSDRAFYKSLAKLLATEKKHVLYDRFTDYFARWLLRNISTAECFTYLEKRLDPGNVRVNLLTTRPVREVFFNVDMRYLLVRKAMKRCEDSHANRFCTIVWKGFSCLEINKIRDEVCLVNCGFVTPSCHPMMILPTNGPEIKKIFCFGDDQIKEKSGNVKEKLLLCLKIEEKWRPVRKLLEEPLMAAVHTYEDGLKHNRLTAEAFASLELMCPGRNFEEMPKKEDNSDIAQIRNQLEKLAQPSAAPPPENTEETAAPPPENTEETAAPPPENTEETAASSPENTEETAASSPENTEETAASSPVNTEETAASSPVNTEETAASSPVNEKENDLRSYILSYVEALVSLDHKEEIITGAFFPDQQKEALIQELWCSTPPQLALLQELEHEGVSHPSVDLMQRLYRQLIGQLIDSVREIKTRDFISSIKEIYNSHNL